MDDNNAAPCSTHSVPTGPAVDAALRAAATVLREHGVQCAVLLALDERPGNVVEVVGENITTCAPGPGLTPHGQRLRLCDALERWCTRLRKQIDAMGGVDLPGSEP